MVTLKKRPGRTARSESLLKKRQERKTTRRKELIHKSRRIVRTHKSRRIVRKDGVVQRYKVNPDNLKNNYYYDRGKTAYRPITQLAAVYRYAFIETIEGELDSEENPPIVARDILEGKEIRGTRKQLLMRFRDKNFFPSEEIKVGVYRGIEEMHIIVGKPTRGYTFRAISSHRKEFNGGL